MLVNVISDLHKSTKRNYEERMTSEKPDCMEVSRAYGFDYWDGDRKYGYGGHYKDDRWKPIAKKLVGMYGLNSMSQVLDIGCGKGYLGYEIQRLTGCTVTGTDVSKYALDRCWINAFKHNIGKDNIFGNYDLILSVNVLHNLSLPELKHALKEINSHSFYSYICMDSYRNERELHNLQCWALTAEQFHKPEEWEFLFNEWSYSGDWEYIFFE